MMSEVLTTIETTKMVTVGKCVIRRTHSGEHQVWVGDIRYWYDPYKLATSDVSALADLRDAIAAILAEPKAVSDE
jgi:hypothetical protein